MDGILGGVTDITGRVHGILGSNERNHMGQAHGISDAVAGITEGSISEEVAGITVCVASRRLGRNHGVCHLGGGGRNHGVRHLGGGGQQVRSV